MRFTTLITLASAPLLAFAAQDAQQQQQDQDTPLITAAPSRNIAASQPTKTALPGAAWNEEAVADANNLELRQAVDLQATQAASVPATQDYWIADHWDSALSTEMWTHVLYTQTFATYPGQLATAGAGEIGLGTHTGEVGVVKAATGGAASVMPQGSLVTGLLGFVGVVAGMGVVLL